MSAGNPDTPAPPPPHPTIVIRADSWVAGTLETKFPGLLNLSVMTICPVSCLGPVGPVGHG